MRVAVFSTRTYERPYLAAANQDRHELVFYEPSLRRDTAGLADGFPAVSAFVHDRLDAGTLLTLQRRGVRLVALRCAGFNHVDVAAADELGVTVLRVPAYSPCAVAEYTVALMQTLNRKLHRAYSRVREGNFSLDGLLGFELRKKTVGIIGTGKIGQCVARILTGYGARLLAYDRFPAEKLREMGIEYVDLDRLLAESDVVTLHAPLTPETRHLINADTLGRMKRGVMIINTSRGELVDTRAVIDGLKTGKVSSMGLDVYEEEGDVFYHDLSEMVIQDDVLARLMTFPNVLITAHQAFFTEEALRNIAETTIANLTGYESGAIPEANRVQPGEHVR